MPNSYQTTKMTPTTWITTLLLSFFCFTIILSCSKSSDGVQEEEDTTNEETETGYNQNVSTPNILFIIADDMGMDATPYATDLTTIKPHMPNLDKLTAEGVRFQNTWSYPRCTPTRGSIITGKHASTTGLLSPGDVIKSTETTLQSYMNSNYATAILGKWHLSGNARADDSSSGIEDLGIHQYKGSMGGGVDNYYNWTLHEDGTTTEITNYYSTTAYTDYAIDWINEQTQPWFCWVAYNAAHTPFHTPEDSSLYTQTGTASLDMYLQMLEAMDSEIGRLLENIPNEELANTTIIFVGDNGTPSQVAQAPFGTGRAKGSLYNGGVNVPLVVAGANVSRQNVSDDALIHTSDLFVTIANLAGANVQSINESISFKHLLTEETVHNRQFLFSEGEANGRAFGGYTVRNKTYKYIYDQDNDAHHLYNMDNDYVENTNLYDGDLTTEEQTAFDALTAEGARLRN